VAGIFQPQSRARKKMPAGTHESDPFGSSCAMSDVVGLEIKILPQEDSPFPYKNIQKNN
jgi:hypothetical protein